MFGNSVKTFKNTVATQTNYWIYAINKLIS